MDAPALTPSQQRALTDLLGAAEHPEFDPDIGSRLRAELESGLAGAAARVGPEGLVAYKAALGQVHACEGNYVAESAEGFAWSAQTARGTIAHKAVELSIAVREELPPAELVELAFERVIEEKWGPSAFLADAPAAELAELRSAAADHVYKFMDEFPPIKTAWRPRLESRLSATLCDDRIELKGKVDLALGQARGTQARVLIVDFKTGRASSAHVDDLRFYALLETLRVGVPPFRVASWYLDSGRWHAEDVTEDTLEVAVRRTVDGVRKMIELVVDHRQATLSPGPSCSWCPAAATCEGAVVWREERASRGLDDLPLP